MFIYFFRYILCDKLALVKTPVPFLFPVDWDSGDCIDYIFIRNNFIKREGGYESDEPSFSIEFVIVQNLFQNTFIRADRDILIDIKIPILANDAFVFKYFARTHRAFVKKKFNLFMTCGAKTIFLVRNVLPAIHTITGKQKIKYDINKNFDMHVYLLCLYFVRSGIPASRNPFLRIRQLSHSPQDDPSSPGS